MEKDIKKNLKKISAEAETRVARTVLRWKYKKEGKHIPSDSELETASRQIAGHVHQVITRRGESVLNDFKKIYFNHHKKEDKTK